MNVRRLLAAAMLFFCPIAGAVFGQSVSVPVRHPVYDYLDRIETKYGMQLIQFSRPFPRMEIASALVRVYTSARRLTPYDKRELEFYFREFSEEISRTGIADSTLAGKTDPRWNLLRVSGTKPFKSFFTADIVLRGEYEIRDGDYQLVSGSTAAAENVFQRSNGVTAFGYAGDHIGATMTWMDNGLKGIPYDKNALRTMRQGVVRGPSTASRDYEYEIAEGQFTYSAEGFRIAVEKMDYWWGSGRTGAIILSDHAPSFPRIGFHVKLTDWLQFEYFHAFLFSDSLDNVRTVLPEGNVGLLKFYESKYYASHAISARPVKNLEVTLGESIIYGGGDVNVLFLIPVISFRAADRWTRATSGNSQFFADVRYNPIPGLTVYGTGFIDEMDLSKILGSEALNKDYNIAYTLGAYATDLYYGIVPMPSETRLEFSRTYPYTYSNNNPLQQYASHQVQMGHWMGANSDAVSFSHRIHPHRSLTLEIGGLYARFADQSHPLPPPPRYQPAFLAKHEYSMADAWGRVEWTPFHGVRVWGRGGLTQIDVVSLQRNTPYPEGVYIGGGISYGIY